MFRNWAGKEGRGKSNDANEERRHGDTSVLLGGIRDYVNYAGNYEKKRIRPHPDRAQEEKKKIQAGGPYQRKSSS